MTVTTANSVIGSENTESNDVSKNIFADQPRGDERAAATTIRVRTASGQAARQNNQPRRDKRDVHGWVILDKPIGMTSTHAVAVLKRLFQAKRAGHAGTLDPLASGGLPIALGEATKTVPVRDGRPQALPLHGRAGARNATPTTPRAGSTQTSDLRPSADGDPGAAAALHRPDRADPAAIFGHQGAGRARL